MKRILVVFVGLFLYNAIYAMDGILSSASYHLCFTPGDDCAQLIVDQIKSARLSIYVQAYSFTSSSIARELVIAKNRGVNVQILLDKSQVKLTGYSPAQFFVNAGVPVWIDSKPAIAHNKIMIFDEQIISTGSFNYTVAANNRNAENDLIINDKKLANLYLQNWQKRRAVSLTVDEYKAKSPSSHS